MSAKHIIKSSQEIVRVLKEGKRYNHPVVTLYMLKTPEYRDPCGRVAYIAGKKLGGAVWRNRSKRVLRAALRLAGGPVPGYDMLLMAKRDTEQVGAKETADAISSLFVRSGLLE